MQFFQYLAAVLPVQFVQINDQSDLNFLLDDLSIRRQYMTLADVDQMADL